jgi:predicted nucleic acid-binding Zn ribbon protein
MEDSPMDKNEVECQRCGRALDEDHYRLCEECRDLENDARENWN